ncbi:MAG: AarF/ABC1/UbiB kinase family protein [Alphaproteobacteria bacterium]|nr:AarF/ABC1/UbiB kinase family protein [Alphaproteobacteria bacterium]MCB9794307.1 AarF/ABC1/UbiB kinase family protein [Alphaproteobacteria bacterium]
MKIVRPVVRTVGGITETVRDLARLREVALILIRHGFGWVVQNLDLPGLPRVRSERGDVNPERVLAAIQELGPTYIKLGQVLSTRPDVIPPNFVLAFQQLQDEVSPLPFAEIEQQLIAELGPAWRDRVARFDEAPLATASIAQVHRAALSSGEEVVFKVQRPGIGAKIRADLSILKLLTRRLMAEFPEIRQLDPKGILEQFERSITAELDFLAEAENMRRFEANFRGVELVRVPGAYPRLTTARVLCIEFLDGVKIREAREAGFDMDLVGKRYLKVAYTMLFDHGFFHGDLHPGNVLILPGGVIGLLDFGMVGRLTRDMKDSLVSLIFALERGDFRTISRVFFDIAVKEQRVDYDAFERDTIEVVERNWVGTSVQDMQIGRFLMDVTRGALRHRVHAPPEYTMFFKALLTTEGLAKALIPEVDPLMAARPYVERLIAERFSTDRVREDLFYNLVTLSALGRRLPITLSQLVDDVDQQRLLLNVAIKADPRANDAHDRRQNRLVLALFSVTAVVCGSLTLGFDAPLVLGFNALSFTFYGVGAALFLATLSMTFMNRG